MKPVIFAGPSIFGLDVSSLDIEVRPPAASGDLLAAVRDGANVIGLIDGLYGDCAAVWHKEILFGLSTGVTVVGAASMGALRAAECSTFGMLGVGEIFECYRDGRRVSDADVAVAHAPAELGYQPVSIALVDAEETIASAAASLGAANASALREAARSLHFSQRTWQSIVARAGLAADYLHALKANVISVERRDAEQLITLLAKQEFSRSQTRTWTLQNTVFFKALLERNRSSDGAH